MTEDVVARPETTPAPASETRTPKGMHDVLWPESARWEDAVRRFGVLVEAAGYGLTLTPIVEHAGVFLRGIGEGSEVVGKEMYVFEDRDGQLMALRPEGTAPIARAFVQHHPVPPWKAWYVAPSFRHENPQHGRYRQHHQLGVEALGPADADLDVEVVSLAHDFFAGLGLREVTLKLHSMGDGACKPGYVALLGAFLAERADQLCEAHRARHLENPLRVLDCKTPECRAATADAPRFFDHLCDPCAAHFARVRAGLEALGVEYTIDHRLVRGFDYYTRTTFEFAADALDAAQNGIGGGGRYDGLVELLGGDPTPGIGFGIGVERVLMACDAEGVFSTVAAVAARPLHAYVDRHGGRGDRPGAHGRVAPGRPAGRPGVRRPLHEVPDQVGRPLGGPGGAGGRAPGGRRGDGRAAAPAQRRRAAHGAPGCHCGRAQELSRQRGVRRGIGQRRRPAPPSPPPPPPDRRERDGVNETDTP